MGNPKGEIIVLCDSDSIVEKDSIAKLVRVFEDPDVGAATGHARALNAEKNILTKLQDTWYDGQFSILKGLESSFNTVTCCSGSLSAYRKEAIKSCIDVWCNDEFLGAEFRPGDDRHLTSYVLGGTKHYLDKTSKAWKAVYCESAIVKTETPTTLRKFINQQIRWKKSWVRMFLFNMPFYYKNRSPIAVICYYLQVALSLITPFIAFRALVLLPLSGRIIDSIVYLLGLLLIGFIYAITFKMRNPASGNRWLYRILMTPLSVGTSFLLYYSLLTIRKKSWLTR
jgi:hyaluronan synthase